MLRFRNGDRSDMISVKVLLTGIHMGTHVIIDQDVVRAAERMAQAQDRTLGEVISELARRSLPTEFAITYRNGIPQLPRRPGVVVTMDMVNALRDDEL